MWLNVVCVISLAVVLCHIASSALVAAPPVRYDIADLKALEAAFVRVSQDVRASVVAVRTYHLRRGTNDEEGPAFRSPRMRNQGSGMIISGDGFILTNNHVVDGPEDMDILIVLHNGMEEQGQVVGRDPRNDLAVLKIEAEHLKAVRFEDTPDVRVGQWTFVVGNPFGMANALGRSSVTVGNVSAVGRSLTGPLTNWGRDDRDLYYGNLIETSAAINPGNSGGPLFNLDGKVIGVVAAIETRSGVSEGVGFAIPIDRYTRRIIEILKHGEQVRYGFLGVVVGPPDMRRIRALGFDRVRGADVTRVSAGEPAADAGLRVDDLIIEFDGLVVESPDHLVRLVGGTPVGTASDITFFRDGKEFTKTVVLAIRPPARQEPPRTDQPD